jgi:dipeptidyl aminopeptidase/acylaminoacyl peptidase
MIRRSFLIIIVAVASIAVGIGISYVVKQQREATRSNRFSTQAPSGAPQNQTVAPVLHPYTIQALRERDYPGSDIMIERELGDQGVFKSYVVSYQSDGLKIYALMNVPDLPKPTDGFPVIVLNHGFIEPTAYDTITSYKSYMDQYSRQGFIVLKPDYRGHDNSQGTPDSAHTSAGYTVDVLNAVSSIKKYPDANPDKIGMWGHSMGGGITLRALAVSKDIKAAALLAGVVASPEFFYNYRREHNSDPRMPDWIRQNGDRTIGEFGSPGSNPDLWNAISPYSYIGDFTTPIQIHHGAADTDVPIVFSEELNKALVDAGKSVEYFVYQDGDHNLAGAARSPVLSRTYDFFHKNLQ